MINSKIFGGVQLMMKWLSSYSTVDAVMKSKAGQEATCRATVIAIQRGWQTVQHALRCKVGHPVPESFWFTHQAWPSPFMAVHSDEEALSDQTITNVRSYGCEALFCLGMEFRLSCWLQGVACMDQYFFQLTEESYWIQMRSTHVDTERWCNHTVTWGCAETCAERAEDCLPGPRQLLLEAQMIKITFQVQQLVTQEEQEHTRC